MGNCPSEPNGEHLMGRRRDGKACAFCGYQEFGSDLTEAERDRLQTFRQQQERKQRGEQYGDD